MIKIGLQTIRLVNSAFFENEVINVDNSTLFLGSSGVGKTTILSALMYYYTGDAKKTRPDKKEKDYFEWHLNSSSSYVMYEYTNLSGKMVLIVCREKGRPRFLFVDANNIDDLESLYLDDNDNVVEFDGLCGNFTDANIYYYRAEKVSEFRKVMHRDSYRLLKNGPTIDFSLFKNEDNTQKFSDQLFKIYKNSIVKDSSIKQMLISIIGDNETTLNLGEFESGLGKALATVDEVDTIKKKKDLIQRLDEDIQEYSALVSSEGDYKNNIRSIYKNSSEIETYIDEVLRETGNKKDALNKDAEEIKEKGKEKFNAYIKSISKLEYEINGINEDKNHYENKMDIKSLIEEEEKKEELEKVYRDKKTQLAALSSDVKNIEKEEQSRKDVVSKEIFNKKTDESKNLNSKKDALNTSLEETYEEKSRRLEEESKEKALDLVIAKDDLTKLTISQVREEGEVKALEGKEISNSLILLIKERLADIVSAKTSQKDTFDSIKEKIKDITREKEEKVLELRAKREDIIEFYTNAITDANKKIDDLEYKLDMNKDNLYGYINRLDPPNKEAILSVVGEDFLFREQQEFYKLDNSETLFGLEIKGDYKKLAERFSNDTLRNTLKDIRFNKSELVATQKQKLDNNEKALNDSESKNNKVLKELIRKKRELEFSLSKLEKDYQRVNLDLEQEVSEEKENIRSSIKVKKESIQKIADQVKAKEAEITNLMNSIEGIISKITNSADNKIREIKSSIDEVKKALSSLSAKYEKLELGQFKDIESEFEKQKISKGIDLNDLNELKKEILVLEKRLNKIDSNSKHTYEYTYRITPLIKSLPECNQTLIDLNDEKDTEEIRINEVLSNVTKELKVLSDTIYKYTTYSNEFTVFLNKAKAIGFLVDYGVEYLSEEDIERILSTKKYVRYLDEYDSVLKNITNLEVAIENHTRRVCDGIGCDNMLNLKTTNGMDVATSSDVNSYISIAKDYIRFLKEDLDVEGLGLQVKTLSEIVNKAYSDLKHIKEDISSINSEINKINGMICSSIEEINVLDYIKLNYYECNTDDIASKIENLGSKFEKEYHIMFSKDTSAQIEVEKIINIAKDLKYILANTNRKEINVSDLSTLTFDVSENGNVYKGELLIGDLGSNGTSIMIKTILYLTLLKKVSNKISHIEGITYHCILDEIGQISADYFSELLKYTHTLGFRFLNGTAANDDDVISFYNTVYTGISEGNRSVMIETKNESIFDEV